MTAGGPSIALCAAVLVAWTAGCSDECSGGACDSTIDAAVDAADEGAPAVEASAGDVVSGDARTEGASATDASSTGAGDATLPPSTLALVRVANWSPGAPAVDFCLAPHGTAAFRGPFVAALLGAETEAGLPVDAGSSGLAFPEVSAYALVPPGQYDARIVVGATCAAGIVADAKGLPAILAGGSATIALVGEESPSGADPGLAIVGFLDDVTPAGAVALRFIHAAPAIASIDVGIGAGSSFAPLFVGIAFGQAGTSKEAPAVDGAAPAVDPQGYLSAPPLEGAVLGARPHGAAGDAGAPMASAPGVSAAPGSVVSVIVTGGTAGTPLGLVECVDNAGTVGPLANCAVVSP
jgi:hypothetical protein